MKELWQRIGSAELFAAPPETTARTLFTTFAWPMQSTEATVPSLQQHLTRLVPTATTTDLHRLETEIEAHLISRQRIFPRSSSRWSIRLLGPTGIASRPAEYDQGRHGFVGLWISSQPLAALPQSALLTPALGRWPFYPKKFWQRQLYLRRPPRVIAGVKQERLLIDIRTGLLWETDTANLLLRIDRQWFTPDWMSTLAGGTFLPGLAVQGLVQRGLVQRRSLTLADLRRASELAICNSLQPQLTAQMPVC